MKSAWMFANLSALALTAAAAGSASRFFPYDYAVDDFGNGLRLITIPTPYPNLVALYIVVRTGSRNEVEPGKSGYAHLFEHMMFRGSKRFSADERQAILKRAGASSNAYTSDDRTVYHAVFPAEDLETILQLEADRFLRLDYSRDVYKTETQAVLGEYNKNSADPINKLFEVLRATAFTRHTYEHTTMGFLEDILEMPNQYDYSRQFYRRYYRPDYASIVLVGQVKRDRALALTKKYFGDWKRGNYIPQIPSEPPQTGSRSTRVDWPSPTLPYLAMAFHGPAYSDQQKDKAALDLLAPIAFGENSELYQRLVLKEQTVDLLEIAFDDQMDPELFTVWSRVKHPDDLEHVRQQILNTFAHFTRELVNPAKLDETRSRLRYSTLLSMNSSEAIADILAPYIALRGSPESMEKLFALYQQITPHDVRQIAARYFSETNRTMVTLATKALSEK